MDGRGTNHAAACIPRALQHRDEADKVLPSRGILRDPDPIRVILVRDIHRAVSICVRADQTVFIIPGPLGQDLVDGMRAWWLLLAPYSYELPWLGLDCRSLSFAGCVSPSRESSRDRRLPPGHTRNDRAISTARITDCPPISRYSASCVLDEASVVFRCRHAITGSYPAA
jgi:hypothetical protein